MAKKTLTFGERVMRALTKTPQSSGKIAAKLGLVGDDGKPTAYHKSKVRKALIELIASGDAVQRKHFRWAEYTKA
jgi:hypothetical protein